jgi:Spy/CpxP family protein refolding chaperone
MKSTKMIAMLAVGGLLALAPALIAADTNTPPASTPPAGGPPAGGPPGGGMRRGGFGFNIEQLTTNLSLTADQIPKVQAVLDDQRKKMTDLMQQASSLSQEDRRTQVQAIRADVTAKMKGILTDDQFAKYQKMRPGNRRPGGGGNGAPPAGAPPQT